MIVETTAKNIEWLFDRLYEARRVCAQNGVDHPTFVLVTRGVEDRQRVERQIYSWFFNKYGQPAMYGKVLPDMSNSSLTRFELPEIGASVVLIDV